MTGNHDISLPVRFQVFHGQVDSQMLHREDRIAEDSSKLCYQEETLLTGTFEVLPPGAGDGIKLIKAPSLREQLRGCLRQFKLSVRQDEPQHSNCSLRVKVDALPIGVAFDVYLRTGSRDQRVSQLRMPAGKRTSYSMGFTFSTPLPESVDVILRSNTAIARDTVDVLEIWDGELVFENVSVVKP
jgi:hypothetical protein